MLALSEFIQTALNELDASKVSTEHVRFIPMPLGATILGPVSADVKKLVCVCGTLAHEHSVMSKQIMDPLTGEPTRPLTPEELNRQAIVMISQTWVGLELVALFRKTEGSIGLNKQWKAWWLSPEQEKANQRRLEQAEKRMTRSPSADGRAAN